MEKIYNTTNNAGVATRYRSSTSTVSRTTVGTCSALSAIFLKNIMTKRPELTNPDAALAQIIAGRNWIDPTDAATFNRAVLSNAGLTSTGVHNCTGVLSLTRYIVANPGYYYITINNQHAVAAVNTATGLFFFDSNDYGLHRFADHTEFETQVRWHLTGAGWPGNLAMSIYKVG